MDPQIVYTKLSEHSTKLGAHGAKIEHIEKAVDEIKGDVKKLLEMRSEAKGGWKVTTVVASVVSFTVGIFLKFWAPH